VFQSGAIAPLFLLAFYGPPGRHPPLDSVMEIGPALSRSLSLKPVLIGYRAGYPSRVSTINRRGLG